MKLKVAKQSLEACLAEFDVWITPSLGEIRDTDRFTEEMDRVVRIFEALATATQGFESIAQCDPAAIADYFTTHTRAMEADAAYADLCALASVLFLVTAKSDNNAKCQLPLFLRDVAKWQSFPRARVRKGVAVVEDGPLPRVLKTEQYMCAVVEARAFADVHRKLLLEFVDFLLKSDADKSQLWSVGRAYCMLREFQKERDLLTPLVLFQVRGSVAASGGHDPERLLREQMEDWGLEPGIDFNTTDVVIELDPRARTAEEKSRAYDFVIPFRAPGWKWQVFVQSQFYAGDSGSVSHKNVDQTGKSRPRVLGAFPKARFVELVDGAGYFASLNSDLKNLIRMPTTSTFVQLRSAGIRLRRELQAIGFLTPLEVEHAALITGGKVNDVTRFLEAEGYSAKEIVRCIDGARARGILAVGHGKVQITNKRRELARRFLLLDLAANHGASLDAKQNGLRGCLMVPGYGPFYGLKLDELGKIAITTAKQVRDDWSKDPTLNLADIRWLCDHGMMASA